MQTESPLVLTWVESVFRSTENFVFIQRKNLAVSSKKDERFCCFHDQSLPKRICWCKSYEIARQQAAKLSIWVREAMVVAILKIKNLTWHSLQNKSRVETVIKATNSIDFSSKESDEGPVGARGKTKSNRRCERSTEEFWSQSAVRRQSRVKKSSLWKTYRRLWEEWWIGGQLQEEKIRECAKYVFTEVGTEVNNLFILSSCFCRSDRHSKFKLFISYHCVENSSWKES